MGGDSRSFLEEKCSVIIIVQGETSWSADGRGGWRHEEGGRSATWPAGRPGGP